MKKYFLYLLLVTASTITYGQSPQAFKYQAVSRDLSGNILVNQPMTMQVDLITDSVDGTVVYSETHSVTSNAFGLVNLDIGRGVVLNGDFASINWAGGPTFIQVSVNGNLLGTSQLLSVPYALFAEKSGSTDGQWTKIGNDLVYMNGRVGINTGNLDAVFKVEDWDPGLGSNCIYGAGAGGYGVRGHIYATSEENWMNVGVYGEANIPEGTAGRGIWGSAFGTGNGGYGVNGESYTTGLNYGVSGTALSMTGNSNDQFGGSFSARGDWNPENGVGTGNHFGILAEAYGGGTYNVGVQGKAQGNHVDGSNYGGDYFGFSSIKNWAMNVGVKGEADSSQYMNRGIMGVTYSNTGMYNYGGRFLAAGSGNPDDYTVNYGVLGTARNNRNQNYGVVGEANAVNYPLAFLEGIYGVTFNAKDHSYALDGTNTCTGKFNVGVGGFVYGNVSEDSLNIGMYAYSCRADTNYAFYGTAFDGSVNYGIYAEVEDSLGLSHAGFFEGNVTITGDLNVLGDVSKGGGTFKIDHPLDPEIQNLVHSFVESPDMLNVYSGNITTDGNGFATIDLPDYFEAANKDFRYQLTCIGTFAQAIIKEKVSGNRFTIQTSVPNTEVSWQVTGVRNDRYANAHRVEPVQMKKESERGKYLHPELYGKTKTERTIPKVGPRNPKPDLYKATMTTDPEK